MPGRAIVHVGLPRTGTTALQHVFHRHRDALSRLGILYPDLTPASAPWSHISHQHLGEALDGRRPASERRELLEMLARQVREAGPDVVLVSYEGLCRLPARHDAPSALSALFSSLGYRMEVLLTVRPQDEWLNSQYGWRTQFILEGRPFEAFFSREMGSRRLRFDELLTPWERVAGSVYAVPLDGAGSRAPLTERVLSAVGLEEVARPVLDERDRSETSNVSPGPVSVEVSRRLRALGMRARLGHVAARDAMRGVEEAARAGGHDATSFAGVDARMRDAARERFAAANELFARRVWGEGWDAVVAASRVRPVNELVRTGVDQETERAIRQLTADACAGANLVPRSPLRRRLDSAAALALDGLDQLRRRVRWARAG